MSTIEARLRRLDGGALLTLWQARTTLLGAPTDLFFYNPKDSSGGTITFQGLTYTPWPMSDDGYEANTSGTLPRPTLTVGNVGGAISAICRDYNDLVGCEVVRRRTLFEFTDGQPGADPTQELPRETFVVNRRTAETNLAVQFELATRLDVEQVQFPRRQMLANACRWEYRGDDCSYAGPPVAGELDDVMGLHFSDGVADGSTKFTSASASFVSGDGGKAIESDGAQIPLDTQIVAYVSPTQVTLSRAITAASGIPFTVVGRVNLRGLYNSATTYAAGDSAYTLVNGIRFYWYSLVNSNTAALTDATKWKLDRCRKGLHSCKLRFGPAGILRTSAFPGIDKLAQA